jgi:hypothetical protein
MRRHARRARKRLHNDIARAYDEIADLCLLAATEDAVANCCSVEHDRRMNRGPGDRRDDCKNVSACLGVLLKQKPAPNAAHCPTGCSAFVPIASLLLTNRPTHLSERASLTTDGAARTGIR